MQEKLLEIINKHFPHSNTDIKEWRKVLENCDSIPSCNYLLSMVDYYVAYKKENSAINLSIVLYQDKEAVGIMPLIAHQNQERIRYFFPSLKFLQLYIYCLLCKRNL